MVCSEKEKTRISICRCNLDDKDQLRAIRIPREQAKFVDKPLKVLTMIKELGLEETSIPYSINLNSRIIGFFTLNFYSLALVHYCDNESECSIQSFMIDASCQRKGYAKKAMGEVVSLLREKHPEIKILKLTVNERNEAAKKLYLACGFKDTGKQYLGGSAGPQHIFSLTLHEVV